MLDYRSTFDSSLGKVVYAKCKNAVIKYGMDSHIKRGVVLGLSGGADSVLLLLFLLKYIDETGCGKVICAHVNHCIRGCEADRDEDFSASICRDLGVEFTSVKIDVPSIAKRDRIGVEECARNARYSYFNSLISSREDISSIAVAHNASDNSETILLNIMRGCGLKGAAGIQPVRDNVIRPLIFVSKSDVEALLSECGVPYVFDSTNSEDDYSRNYIRLHILPLFKQLNSSPDEMFSRLSENLRSDDSFIAEAADDFIALHENILVKDLRSLHRAVLSRVISSLITGAGGGVSSAVLSDIISLLNSDNFSYSLPGKKRFVCDHGLVSVVCDVDEKENYFFELTDGLNSIEEFDSAVSVSDSKEFYLNVYKISIQANLSSAIIKGRLYLRPRRDGDTVYYGGMTHKLKKMLCDKKIPRDKRQLIPVLCDESGVVWMPGFGVRDDKPESPAVRFVTLYIGVGNETGKKRFYSASEFN